MEAGYLRCFRRGLSSSRVIGNNLSKVVSNFQRAIKSKKWLIEDDLSATQGHKLFKTLDSLKEQFPKSDSSLFQTHRHNKPQTQLLPGQEIPMGYQFIYFNPSNYENLLGEDGYDNHQAPVDSKEPNKDIYKRRMWVGGQLSFNNENPLRFNELSTCIESIKKVISASNCQNVIVSIDRKMFNGTDLSLKETRSLIYTNEEFNLVKLKQTAIIANESDKYSQYLEVLPSLKLSQSFLFRYSALTFNAHRIHYDLNYTTKQELYPNLLVHGPLTITLLLQWVNYKLCHSSNPSSHTFKKIQQFMYKNSYPLFLNDKLTFKLNRESEDVFDVWIENQEGIVCCKAKVTVEECI